MASSTAKSKSKAAKATPAKKTRKPSGKAPKKAAKATKSKSAAKKKVPVQTKSKSTKKPAKRGKSMSENEKGKEEQDALNQLATDNSLETVRDILFGAQVKQANERDQQLEKLINTRADSLQKSLDSQMNSVENTIAKLTEKLAKESAQTASNVEQKFKQIEELIKNNDKKTKDSQQEMYDELVAEREALESNAQTWNEDLAKELENVHHQLKESKTDRLSLANLLTDMAASLIADPKPAKK